MWSWSVEKLRVATQIDRYQARLILVPLLATLALAAMLLLLEKMLRLFDFVVSEGGPVNVVWRMLANLIPEYLGLGIPIGLMLGILLVFTGVQFISTGLLAEMQARTYHESQDKPIYVIRDIRESPQPETLPHSLSV